MKKYQVWVGGKNLLDVEAKDGNGARRTARDILGVSRLPKETSVCEIPYGYYAEIVEMNRRQGFDASNL